MTNEQMQAINANTAALERLIAVWEKLYAKAKQIEADPTIHTITAAGVPVIKPTESSNGGFVL